MGAGAEGYRSLEHVTDAFIEAWGPTFEKALAQAGIGLFDTIVDVGKVKSTLRDEIEVSGHDELELVYNWLEELLLSFEIRKRVFGQLEIKRIVSTGKQIQLRAEARGEAYDPARHGGKVEVKGVTYHLMDINRQPGIVRIKYLLDL
jgi:SHS2 domain-containing protein